MVNIHKFKLTKLQQEILRLLFIRAGSQLNQRQIANAIKVSQPAIMKAIPYLEKENIISINKDKESNRWAIELNKNNNLIKQLKRVDNLKQIYETGLVDFLEEKFAGGIIILFGSYSRGEDLINSNIDIAIVGRKDKQLDLKEYEKILSREININFYNSFKEINKNLKENLCNGIVLIGGIEL